MPVFFTGTWIPKITYFGFKTDQFSSHTFFSFFVQCNNSPAIITKSDRTKKNKNHSTTISIQFLRTLSLSISRAHLIVLTHCAHPSGSTWTANHTVLVYKSYKHKSVTKTKQADECYRHMQYNTFERLDSNLQQQLSECNSCSFNVRSMRLSMLFQSDFQVPFLNPYVKNK